MRKGKGEEPQSDNTEIEQTEVQQEESQESNFAKVDVVTSEKKVTMSAPVKEFEDFKNSFKSMMAAFANFIETAGLEIGKDETSTTINMLRLKLDQMRKDLQSEQAKIRDGLVPRSEFEELKAATEERAAKASEDYVTRGEFERFRAAVREVI
jgi:hypothetical protein